MLDPKKTFHFIGVGGSGMNPLAHILVNMGFNISGSDIKENIYTLKLKEKGATIYYGHNASNIRLADIIVISSAIKETNEEYMEAKRLNLPIIKRAELLSAIMDKHHHRIAVSGTHGKTTVTSFLSHFLDINHKSPTYIIGSTLKHNNVSSNYGKTEYCIAEADESDRSFLFLNPNIIVITNIEEDHLDQFKDLSDIKSTFQKLIQRMDSMTGLLIINGDDQNIKDIIPKNTERITYGFEKHNIIKAEEIKETEQGLTFNVSVYNKTIATNILLNIPGKHNIHNSLTVFALAYYFKLPFETVTESFKNFYGASRRFHKIGEVNNISIYDDYAHHPTEIKCTLEAAKTLKHNRLVIIFQPHRHSRFQKFYQDFSKALQVADLIFVTDIYSAGEDAIPGFGIDNLINILPPNKTNYIKQVSNISSEIIKILKPGDFVITLGAGDVTNTAKEIYRTLKIQEENEQETEREITE